jgi:cell division septal protein FtsQ
LRKKLRSRFNRLGIGFFVVSILGGLIYVLGWSSLITIQSVEIKGTNQGNLISAQLLAGRSNLVLGEPLARINPKHEENLITDLEWIKAAEVSRNWWSREVEVLVTPKIPIAIFKIEGAAETKPRYLASDGSDFSSPQVFTNLATVSLINNGQNLVGQRRIIAGFVANLPADLIPGLQNLEITGKGEVIMATNLRKPTLRINWGSSNTPEEIVVKSNVLMDLLDLPENKKITYVDLTLANSPVVK